MFEEAIYRVLFALAGVSVIAVATVHRGGARRRAGKVTVSETVGGEGIGIFLILRLVGLVMWLSLLIYPLAPRLLAWAQVPLPDWLRLAAGAVALFAVPPFVIWAARSIRDNVTPTVITRDAHQLVTTGPYRWIRNPLYTGGIVFFVAMDILAANVFLLAISLIGLIGILARLPEEESRLAERFGDEYRAYVARTGRFLPRLLPGSGYRS